MIGAPRWKLVGMSGIRCGGLTIGDESLKGSGNGELVVEDDQTEGFRENIVAGFTLEESSNTEQRLLHHRSVDQQVVPVAVTPKNSDAGSGRKPNDATAFVIWFRSFRRLRSRTFFRLDATTS